MLRPLVLLLLVNSPAAAQEVRWRTDYEAALKDAAAAGKPLLLDFGTEACVWCRKQDATTLRDPKIVARLNAQFVPVKVDGNQYPKLTAALRVEAYPTLVLAGPGGQVLGRHTGYADVSQLLALLDKAGAASPAPPRLLARANAAFAAGRYAECLRLCRQLADEKSPDATAARRLADAVTADPAKWRAAGEQIDAGLAELRAELAATLR